MAHLVKNPPAARETWVQSLGWEDPLEKGKATHSSILAWRILWNCVVHGFAKSQTEWLSLTTEYTELCKKALNDPDNYDGMTIHLKLDILDCEVKWALGGITTNRASGPDGILAELFQILKDDAVKVLYSLYQQIWKTQQWPLDWKR